MFASKDDLVKYWSYSVQLTVLYLTNTTYNLFPNPLSHWGPKHNSYTYLPLECTYTYTWIGNGTILQNVQIMETNQLCNYTHIFFLHIHNAESTCNTKQYSCTCISKSFLKKSLQYVVYILWLLVLKSTKLALTSLWKLQCIIS